MEGESICCEDAPEEDSYVCNVCKDLFSHICYVKLNTPGHWNAANKLYYCNECHRAYARSTPLYKHSFTHSGTSDAHSGPSGETARWPYPCSKCNKSFAYKSNLNKHMLVHSLEKSSVSCEKHDKSPSYKPEFKRQMVKHSGRKTFSCNICHKYYVNEERLRQHLLKHAEQTTLSSNDYPKPQTLTHKEYLEKHLYPFTSDPIYLGSNLHLLSNEEKIEFLKSVASSEAKSEMSTVVEHLEDEQGDYQFEPEIHIGIKEGQYVNIDEDDPLPTEGNVIASESYSELISSEEGEYECTMCKELFSQVCYIKSDSRGHWNPVQKVHHCNVCHRPYVSSGLLYKHSLTHTGESGKKPYPCDKCSESFMYKRDLNKHLLVHSCPKKP